MEVRAAESGGQSAGGGKAGCPVAALSAFGGKGDLPDKAARVGRKYARRGQSAEFVRTAYASDPQRESAYEFGRLVRLDEVEHGIVSGYKILEGNAADTNSWMPALDQHQACFGHLPQMATADRGFFSAKNESEAQVLGVKRVALPARGRLSAQRAKQQKQRWFRRALRWRAGCEATISTLKHPFSMLRASYKRDSGFQRYVGWCVITKNLFSIARNTEELRRG